MVFSGRSRTGWLVSKLHVNYKSTRFVIGFARQVLGAVGRACACLMCWCCVAGVMGICEVCLSPICLFARDGVVSRSGVGARSSEIVVLYRFNVHQ